MKKSMLFLLSLTLLSTPLAHAASTPALSAKQRNIIRWGSVATTALGCVLTVSCGIKSIIAHYATNGIRNAPYHRSLNPQAAHNPIIRLEDLRFYQKPEFWDRMCSVGIGLMAAGLMTGIASAVYEYKIRKNRSGK